MSKLPLKHPCTGCKHATHYSLGMWYCEKERRYIDKLFRSVWGCDNYRYKYDKHVKQIDLFEASGKEE